jgi:head-tail adaptor
MSKAIISNFKNIIYIEEKYEIQNEDGEILVGYSPFRRYWANIIRNNNKWSFLVRFQRDLPDFFRIYYNGCYYHPTNIIDVNDRAGIIKIHAQEL